MQTLHWKKVIITRGGYVNHIICKVYRKFTEKVFLKNLTLKFKVKNAKKRTKLQVT